MNAVTEGYPRPGATGEPVFRVSADLPGLPGVPAEVAPVKCLGCGERKAIVRHSCEGPDADLTAVMICDGCGSVFDLFAASHGYLAGLEVGVLVEAARRGDPRIERPGPTAHRGVGTDLGGGRVQGADRG